MDRAAVHTFGVLAAVVAGCITRKMDETSLRPRLLYAGYQNKWTIFCHNTNNNACPNSPSLALSLVSELASVQSIPLEKELLIIVKLLHYGMGLVHIIISQQKNKHHV